MLLNIPHQSSSVFGREGERERGRDGEKGPSHFPPFSCAIATSLKHRLVCCQPFPMVTFCGNVYTIVLGNEGGGERIVGKGSIL
jgi:hypothetical protein